MKPEHLTLHRYFLNASRNRSLFLSRLEELGEKAFAHPHTRIHLDFWYGCLYVVIEGWRQESITDAATDTLLLNKKKVNLLRESRNATFHYHPKYIEPRVDAVYSDEEFVQWVHALHDAMSDFFLRA
jgi:hypothetical protein